MKKALVRTYGCQMNERDSENIAAAFVERGWEITDDENVADIIVVNTCSVREQAEQKAIGKLWHLVSHRRAQKKVLPIIGVTGCMAQNLGAKIAEEVAGIDFIAGARKTHVVPDIAIKIYEQRIKEPLGDEIFARAKPDRKEKRELAARTVIDISDDLTSHLHIDKHIEKQEYKPTALVSIMQGCQMNCSYCIVPKVRGLQRSRPTKEIVEEVKALAERGVKEVMLLGQVVNAFGREIPKQNGVGEFVRLLQKINDIDGIERIRFMSPHPSYFGDDLIDAYSSLEKLCEYVHLPMQSGSDDILRKMNRPYKAKRFLEIVEKLRAKKNMISLSTDVIVGFPTETDDDFAQTCDVFKQANFDMAFIFKYSPRAGTKSAEQLDDIPEELKESRNQALLEILAKQSLEFNNALISTTQQVLVEGCAKRGADMYMGRTRTHRKAIFKGDDSLIGKTLPVKILRANVSALEGEIVS